MKSACIFSKPFGACNDLKELDEPTPVKIFYALFTKEIIEHIVFQTNLYAQQSEKNFKPTTDNELKCFFRNKFTNGNQKITKLQRLLEH